MPFSSMQQPEQSPNTPAAKNLEQMDKLLSELAQLRERQRLGLEPDEDGVFDDEEEEEEGEEYVMWRLEDATTSQDAALTSTAASTAPAPTAPAPKATTKSQPASASPSWVSDWQEQPGNQQQGPGGQQSSPKQQPRRTMFPQPKVRKVQLPPDAADCLKTK
jgi:hypothetical protein